MTLKELASLVSKKRKHTPNARELRASDEPIIVEGKHSTGTATVYQSGYVLYTEDKHHTVFHISEIIEKRTRYLTSHSDVVPEQSRIIDGEYFQDLDWIIPVVMLGNKRIIHNIIAQQEKRVDYHYSRLIEEPMDLSYLPEYLSPETELLEHKRGMVDEVRDRIVPTQWIVYVGVVGHRMTEKQLAVHLNITQQAVCKRLLKARKNISKVKTEVQKKNDIE